MKFNTFKNISRDDLGKYTPDTMQGIYNSLTPENKLNIWQSKLNNVILSEEFSDVEKEYLIKVKDMLTRDLFDDNIKKDVDGFIEPIIDQAIQFGWDDNKIARVFSTPYSFPEIVKISGKRPDLESNGGSGAGGGNNCNCSATSYNLCWNSCGYLKNNCYILPSGCGVLFLGQCNGQCN